MFAQPEMASLCPKFFFSLTLLWGMWALSSPKPCPLHWKNGVLTTGPSGKSCLSLLIDIFCLSFHFLSSLSPLQSLLYQQTPGTWVIWPRASVHGKNSDKSGYHFLEHLLHAGHNAEHLTRMTSFNFNCIILCAGFIFIITPLKIGGRLLSFLYPQWLRWSCAK